MKNMSLPTETRTLFSEESLGITRLLDRRDQYKKQFENLEDGFRKKMQNYVDSPNEMIFSEDLKSMIHLAESTPADKELLVNMIKKYNSQPGEMRFSNFTFGPVVMRSLYHLNAADEALKLFTDPEFAGFFNQLTSYQVLLQLLYKNKRYADMRSVYDTIKETVTEGRVHPKNGLILVTAGCYKEVKEEKKIAMIFLYFLFLLLFVLFLFYFHLRKMSNFILFFRILRKACPTRWQFCEIWTHVA